MKDNNKHKFHYIRGVSLNLCYSYTPGCCHARDDNMKSEETYQCNVKIPSPSPCSLELKLLFRFHLRFDLSRKLKNIQNVYSVYTHLFVGVFHCI